ncbi:MAG TPA: DNA-3-methyladenine glycosylase 2 family protein [Candidatus Krumholzibacteria bacterium]|nr:DNA-3-methyladenine glycosylase 2 family protein [Candidatus Krumholzibacteria bacterium]
MSSSASHARRVQAEIDDAVAHLRRRDAVLGAVIERVGPCRMRTGRDLFEVMLETIVSQQLSSRAADTIYSRLDAAMGTARPQSLLALSDAELRACGLSRAKTAYVRNVAREFDAQRYTRRSFANRDDQSVMDMLTSIKGVGQWSAHIFLIFGLHRMDVFPIGDLGLRKGMLQTYGLRSNTRPARLERIAEAWRPYRSVGSLYMWRGYDGG